MNYDPGELEAKWRRRWAEEGRYEVDPDDGEPFFITVPYPYPNGGMHIGHARTYSVPDVYARYRRLQGDNVLYPIAWHVTGTPIVGAVDRLKNREPRQLAVLTETFEVPQERLGELETPMDFARYFIDEHYKKGMEGLGLSIDWRREFTTNDERYSKFIAWQYEMLNERGLLEKGLHPVNYCTREENPVTTHDIYEGEEAEFQDYTLIKFRQEDVVVPMATLRPETVWGVTNAYVKPDATYVRARVNHEEWVISAEAVEKLELQAHDVEVHEEFTGERLVGERVANPVTDEEVLVLPASFVDPDSATGIVMSVPAHSPDDWVALQEAKADTESMTEYGIDPAEVEAIEPRAILTIEGYGESPAKDAVEEYGIESQDDPALEEATQEVYNREFHSGRLEEMYGPYAGEVVEDVRDELKADYESRGAFDSMHDYTVEVICRCGGEVEVAEQETWFLRYNDEEWKARARKAVDRLDAIPENTREQYYHTIDWLEEWPAIRNYGLGTRLPWDDEFIIEPLSDSTIYMAYYTIAHLIDDVPVEELDREFFDTLFLGPEAVDDPDETAAELREEWEYWYPVDVRCSANDLISNHLTFFLYHHAELFEEEKWPLGITVMGMGLLEGQSMSSSKGHVVLASEAIERYGADTVRFFLLNSSEPWQDFDWRSEQVEGTRKQLERFFSRAREVIEAPAGERNLKSVDCWLLAKLQATIQDATEAMDAFETRTASQTAFYGFEEHLKWYRRRADLDRPGARWTLRQVLDARLRLLAPFVPFVANELYEQLAGIPVEDADWPEPDPEFESPRIEVEEGLVQDLFADVREVVEVTGTDPGTIRIYVAADWKRRVFEAVVEKGPDVGAVMGSVMQRESLRERGDEVNELVQQLVEDVRERPEWAVEKLVEIDERSVYEDAARFLSREFDAEIEIYGKGDADVYDPGERAGKAVPFRPAIHLE
jgi:leucyl-tRNA synthetase